MDTLLYNINNQNAQEIKDLGFENLTVSDINISNSLVIEKGDQIQLTNVPFNTTKSAGVLRINAVSITAGALINVVLNNPLILSDSVVIFTMITTDAECKLLNLITGAVSAGSATVQIFNNAPVATYAGGMRLNYLIV